VFTTLFRPVVGPNQLPVSVDTGSSFPRVWHRERKARHSPSYTVLGLRMHGTYIHPPIPLHGLVHRYNFAFYWIGVLWVHLPQQCRVWLSLAEGRLSHPVFCGSDRFNSFAASDTCVASRNTFLNQAFIYNSMHHLSLSHIYVTTECKNVTHLH
jgi:hypothetical protein